jgi:NitT/TauT family transport system substrate-binding protein
MQDLLGRTVATVSEVPTPWVALQHDLRNAGIDPGSIRRLTGRTMAENVAALRAGEVDVIQIFHPFARTLVDEGVAHLWYAAASRGLACYTTLNTKREFATKHPEVVLSVTRAVYRTQKWIAAHDGGDLAQVVARYLPDIPLAVLTVCCNEYKASEVWSPRPVVQRAGLEWKREAMLSSGSIKKRYDYEDYVEGRFAEQVLREDPPSI